MNIAVKAYQRYRPAYRNKVFGVGYLKTGTTSLRRAFERLGYKHCGWSKANRALYKRGDFDALLDIARRHESFEDLPWNKPDLIEFLLPHFPRARFVLTVRDESAWLRSWHKHNAKWGGHNTEAEALAIYHRHTDAMHALLAPTGRLLVIDVTAGDGYDKLCPFLGKRVLQEPFPHTNVTKYASPE